VVWLWRHETRAVAQPCLYIGATLTLYLTCIEVDFRRPNRSNTGCIEVHCYLMEFLRHKLHAPYHAYCNYQPSLVMGVPYYRVSDYSIQRTHLQCGAQLLIVAMTVSELCLVAVLEWNRRLILDAGRYDESLGLT
jgi:hypothetical protein